MNELEKDIALLESYLEGNLGNQEKHRVEARIAEEEEFAKLSNQLKVLVEGIGYAGRNKILQQLQEIETGLPEIDLNEADTPAKVVSLKQRNHWWAAAASIAVLVVSGLFIFNQRLTPAEVFENYIEAYPNIDRPTTRGEIIEMDIEYRAYAAYDQYNYVLAIEFFNQMPETDMDSINYLYLGISYLMNNQSAEAINSLDLAQKNAGNLRNQVNWYLGMAYLKSGDLEKAKEVFTILKNSDYAKSGKAGKILKSLN